ncbi:hypothetical protein NUACC26_076100 [Scytonema sp. NUACC26]
MAYTPVSMRCKPYKISTSSLFFPSILIDVFGESKTLSFLLQGAVFYLNCTFSTPWYITIYLYTIRLSIMQSYFSCDTALQFFVIVDLASIIFIMLVSTVGLALTETIEARD